jgi:signal transduction histidine kinase
MRKWIDRAWAKVTAFCLLIVFSVLLLLGGALIVYLGANNVYLDGGQQLRAGLFSDVCYDELHSAEDYLWAQTGGAIVPAYLAGEQAASVEPWDGDTELLGKSFAQRFIDSSCSLRLYTMEAELLFSNYLSTDGSLCAVEEPLYAGVEAAKEGTPSYVLRAELTTQYRSNNFDVRVIDTAIRCRYGVAALELLFLAGWVFFLSFTLASAGHWQGHEGIHLTWFDRIPVDLWLFLLFFYYAVTDSPYNRYNVFSIAGGVVLLYLFLTVFSAQCKAGTVIRGSAVAWLLRLLWRALRWLGRVLSSIPLVWRTTLGVTAMLLLDLLCVLNYWDSEFLIIMLLFNLLMGLFLIYIAIGLRKLQKGGHELAAGNYDNRVDTRFLIGDFRRHAEDLNAVQQGMRRAVEEQLKSERMKTELITNVSHDIKTPLTSIVNYVDLLKKEEIDNPAAEEYIAVLDRQSSRLRKLTEDLVEASKAASGAIPVALADTDVNVFLSQVAGEYRQRLADNGIEPVLTLDETSPHIRADGKLLWRVLDNLMSNVCKYAMPGTRVYLSSEALRGRVLITVKNVSRYPLNISADELTERFVRGDASRSTDGSGLGLSIATGLTRLQQGDFLLSVDGDLFKAQLDFAAYTE